jgi:hypothetical protein
MTSVSGTADLETWTDALGNTGIDAADAICRERARLAGLTNYSMFVAWVSDDDDDAYCRVHGLSGTKAGNCGLSSLPTGAGPWLRIDGAPFGATIDQMIYPTGRIYHPMTLDETGAAVSLSEAYFTGTDREGVLHAGYTCVDWTAANSDWATLGLPRTTTDQWSHGGSSPCSSARRLLCLQTGAGKVLPPFWEPGARVFVSSQVWTGNLGGISGADDKCRSLAADAGLPAPDSFEAMLSASGSPAVGRLTHDGPFVRIDGVRVADSKADLFDGELAASINVTEHGTYIGNHAAWTGSNADGSSTGIDCSGWLSSNSGGSATHGGVNQVDSSWLSDFSPVPCGPSAFHIYCVSEVSVHILEDGFESCSTGGWSTSVGE